MSADASLQQRLLESVFLHEYASSAPRVDYDRFAVPSRIGFQRRAVTSLKRWVKARLWSTVFQRPFRLAAAKHVERLGSIARYLPRIESLYHKLEDSHSREVLVAVVCYRILGANEYA